VEAEPTLPASAIQEGPPGLESQDHLRAVRPEQPRKCRMETTSATEPVACHILMQLAVLMLTKRHDTNAELCISPVRLIASLMTWVI
jgi:hypothetical protein